MKKKFTINNPIPPIWLRYPAIPQNSIGWRMGSGEDYKFKFYSWLKKMTEEDQQTYHKMFPQPIFWRDLLGEEAEDEASKNYSYNHIPFWQKKGKPKYSLGELLASENTDDLEYIFFWKPNPNTVDKSCLGQWQPSEFNMGIGKYLCAEHYMMAEKARLFDDEDIEKLIMQATDPGEMKTLGKKVKSFDPTIWDRVKHSIILMGNYYKFTQNKAMRDFLLATGDKILVEASPMDIIWGIGFGEDNSKAHNPYMWRGQNLLGFALMEVRDELRRLYKHYDKIDWESINRL